MDITIVGTGNMARGIATRALTGGNGVTLLGTSIEKAQALAGELSGDVRAGQVGDSLSGEMVVLAVWYQAVDDVLRRYEGGLDGKVVVDITNPVDFASFDRLVTPPDSSAAEEIAKLLPDGTPVVKAFNTTFAGTLVAGSVAGQQLDVLLASDDEDAKQKVAAFVTAGGLRPIDAGPLRRARQLEHLGFLHMALQNSLGSQYASTVKLLW
jgi:8-hydroxy-5-deazaflavin:NADPH oxidoreductase